MQGQYSMRSPAVKRLMKEAQELSEPTEQYYAQPLDDNLFEWHFTIRGPGDSEFDGGIYHGRIILPPEYPMKPPSIILLTPNGRFETNKKICLSISGHHPESWQPSWSIRTALLAIIGFMPTHGAGAIGSLNYSSEERKKLAKRSLDWKCPTCGGINYILKAVTSESEKTKQEAKELATQINFQGEKEKKQTDESMTPSAPEPQQNTSTNLQQASVNSDSPNQAFHFPGMPQTFGQMPFTRFPFPPPFMLGSLPASYTSSSVPRFPPPPPFIPGMFPPGLMHTMPNAQQGNMNFMMPSWPGNPYVVSQSQTVSNSHGIVGNQASSGNPSPASGQQGSSLNSEKKTQSTESGMSASAVSESSDLESQVKVDSDSSEALAKPDTSVESGTVDKVVTDNSDNMETVDNTDERIVHEPITNITDHVMEEDNNVTQEEPILRHRTLYNEDIPQTVPAGRVGQTAEIPHEQQQSGITFSTVLIVLIGIAIALLLIRRFFLSRNWKFYYGH